MMNQTNQALIDRFMNTYHRLPVVFTGGSGAHLTDRNGKTYLDFTAGIAVNCLGHNHPALVKAISEQAKKLIHTSNYFLSDTSLAFADRLVEACKGAGMERVFLSNSGAEANEGAIKIARKYSQTRYGGGRHRIVSLKGSFHGRTLATLSATGQDRLHPESFAPYPEGFLYVEPNNIDAMDRALDGTVAAVLMEPIQGESGIWPLEVSYVRQVARLCQERDVLLMFDEIQSGMGRTGTFLASEIYQVQVDVVTLAKGLAGGVPIGAVLAGAKTKETLSISDHGSTFGGNPLAAAAGLTVLDLVDRPEMLAEISRKGALLMDTIRSWEHPAVRDIRGRGLMLGIDIASDAWPVLEAALQRGLLLLSAGQNTLRLLPPYVITDAEIAEGLGILRSVLDSLPLRG